MSTYFNTKYSTGLKILSFCAFITGYNTVMPMDMATKCIKYVATKIVMPTGMDYIGNNLEITRGAINIFRGQTFTFPSNAAGFASSVNLVVNICIPLTDMILNKYLPLKNKKNGITKNIALHLLIPLILQCGVIIYLSKDTLKNKALYGLLSLASTLVANHDKTWSLISCLGN